MGRRARNKKLRREQEKEAQKIQALPWQKRAPFWVLFLYRFSISFLLILPFALIALYIVKIQMTPTDSVNTTTAIIKTDLGDITLKLYDDDAPKTVENFTKLAKKGYYDGLIFHRVIQDFMIQAGDPNCISNDPAKQCGAGGTSIWGKPFKDEINPKGLGISADILKSLKEKGYEYRDDLKSHKMTIGSIAMANAGPNTNGSQFFIVTQKDQPHLNGQHTVFGMVEDGMNAVSAIAAVKVDENDRPEEDVKIKSITISN